MQAVVTCLFVAIRDSSPLGRIRRYYAAYQISIKINSTTADASNTKGAKGKVYDAMVRRSFPKNHQPSDEELAARRKELMKAKLSGDKLGYFVDAFGIGILVIIALALPPLVLHNWQCWMCRVQVEVLKGMVAHDYRKAAELVEDAIKEIVYRRRLRKVCLTTEWKNRLAALVDVNAEDHTPSECKTEGDLTPSVCETEADLFPSECETEVDLSSLECEIEA